MEELEFYKEWCLIMYDYACSCFINDTIDKNEILEVQKDFEKMKSDILKFYKNGNLKKLMEWYSSSNPQLSSSASFLRLNVLSSLN